MRSKFAGCILEVGMARRGWQLGRVGRGANVDLLGTGMDACAGVPVGARSFVGMSIPGVWMRAGILK